MIKWRESGRIIRGTIKMQLTTSTARMPPVTLKSQPSTPGTSFQLAAQPSQDSFQSSRKVKFNGSLDLCIPIALVLGAFSIGTFLLFPASREQNQRVYPDDDMEKPSPPFARLPSRLTVMTQQDRAQLKLNFKSFIDKSLTS